MLNFLEVVQALGGPTIVVAVIYFATLVLLPILLVAFFPSAADRAERLLKAVANLLKALQGSRYPKESRASQRKIARSRQRKSGREGRSCKK